MALESLRTRTSDGRTALEGSGIVKDARDVIVTTFNRIIAVLNNLTSMDDATGDKTIYLKSDKSAYIRFNSSNNAIEFWINNNLEGLLDAGGLSTEPN